eukprot:1181442-Pleurochrysis_carterae.AAC.1
MYLFYYLSSCNCARARTFARSSSQSGRTGTSAYGTAWCGRCRKGCSRKSGRAQARRRGLACKGSVTGEEVGR